MSNDTKNWPVAKDLSQYWGLAVERRLALLIITVFVIACVALMIKALVTATSSNELLKVLEVIKSLLPSLILLLAPILHHYFRQKQEDKGEKSLTTQPLLPNHSQAEITRTAHRGPSALVRSEPEHRRKNDSKD